MEKKLTFRMPEDTLEKLKELSQRENTSKNNFVNMAIEKLYSSDDTKIKYALEAINKKIRFIDTNIEVITELLNNISYQLQDKGSINTFISSYDMENDLLKEARISVSKKIEQRQLNERL